MIKRYGQNQSINGFREKMKQPSIKLWYKNIALVFGIMSLILGYTVFYLSLSSSYPSNLETSITILIIIIASLYFTKLKTTEVTIILLYLLYTLFLLFWSLNVPYILLLPIIVFIIVSIKYSNKANIYFALISVILPYFELLPHFPIDSTIISAGLPNLLLTSTLQILIYIPLAILIKTYKLFISSFEEAFGNHPKSSSTNFISSLIIKGLYISIVLHFVNNVLNSAIWSTGRTQNLFQLLKIYASSDQDETTTNPTNLHSLLKLLTRYYTDLGCKMQLDPIKATHTDATPLRMPRSLAVIILHDILHNFYKYSSNIVIATTGNMVEIRGDIKPGVVVKQARVYSRNLGNIKNLLQLTELGNIEARIRGRRFLVRVGG